MKQSPGARPPGPTIVGVKHWPSVQTSPASSSQSKSVKQSPGARPPGPTIVGVKHSLSLHTSPDGQSESLKQNVGKGRVPGN